MSRDRLRLVQPGTPPPDTRAEVARALLGPISQPAENATLAWLGDVDAVTGLLTDPRFVLGRLAQALTMLLRDDFPPPNATEELLIQALEDAQAHRRASCPRCPADSICDQCRAGWDLADKYEWLYSELGLIAQRPHRPDLKDVSR